MRAHQHARQQFELWAQQECIAVDACAAFLSSQALSERLLQLRLQYDTCVPGVTHFARTLKLHATTMHKFSCSVERWRRTGMLPDSDAEAYNLISSGSMKRVAMHAAPPRVMASFLLSVAGSRSERNMLRWRAVLTVVVCI
jgi:hypothetical protein